jgi:hypothetical protein
VGEWEHGLELAGSRDAAGTMAMPGEPDPHRSYQCGGEDAAAIPSFAAARCDLSQVRHVPMSRVPS